jgi:hypothetical protein
MLSKGSFLDLVVGSNWFPWCLLVCSRDGYTDTRAHDPAHFGYWFKRIIALLLEIVLLIIHTIIFMLVESTWAGIAKSFA